MLRRLTGTKTLFFAFCCVAALALAITTTTIPNAAADLSGREILSVSRIALGGADYAGLQNVTVQASGFVNAAAFGGLASNPLGAMAEIKLRITDYQDKQMRRRLDVAPTGAALAAGPTYLVFTGSQGGGMMFGTEVRVRETAASRHWAMLGFD